MHSANTKIYNYIENSAHTLVQPSPGLPVVRRSPKSPNDSTFVWPAAAYTRHANNTARYVRPSCVRRDWSDRLERTEQRPA